MQCCMQSWGWACIVPALLKLCCLVDLVMLSHSSGHPAHGHFHSYNNVRSSRAIRLNYMCNGSSFFCEPHPLMILQTCITVYTCTHEFISAWFCLYGAMLIPIGSRLVLQQSNSVTLTLLCNIIPWMWGICRPRAEGVYFRQIPSSHGITDIFHLGDSTPSEELLPAYLYWTLKTSVVVKT